MRESAISLDVEERRSQLKEFVVVEYLCSLKLSGQLRVVRRGHAPLNYTI